MKQTDFFLFFSRLSLWFLLNFSSVHYIFSMSRKNSIQFYLIWFETGIRIIKCELVNSKATFLSLALCLSRKVSLLVCFFSSPLKEFIKLRKRLIEIGKVNLKSTHKYYIEWLIAWFDFTAYQNFAVYLKPDNIFKL